MRPISLLYHDVVLPGQLEASGFSGADAALYKLDLPDCEEPLRAIWSATESSPGTVRLTFDDGGCSAHAYIADCLEKFHWRAHFFVTTDWIDRRGFLSPSQIRDL